MRKTIVRTITATTISSAIVTCIKGKMELTVKPTLTVNGIVDEKTALKIVRKEYGDLAQVTNIESVDDVYEITVEDFIKYATKVEAENKEESTPEQKEV